MSKRKVTVSRPLNEMVKGSYDYVIDEVRRAFNTQFMRTPDADGRIRDYWVVETMPDAVLVREYNEQELGPDEFYRVSYAKDADGKITFAVRKAWEEVELVYQARTEPAGEGPGAEPAMSEAQGGGRGGQRRRLEERVEPRAEFVEAAGSGNGQTRRIRIKGLMQAGVVNGNGRRYSADVLREAVERWRSHLHESAGRGRLQILTGEAEHPGDKGNRGARFLETVVKWTDVEFDGQNVDVAGELILTTKGRDVATLMESGVHPGGSVRGFYESKAVKEGGRAVEEVSWCEITGADLVGDPSFENAADLLESKGNGGRAGAQPGEGDDEMNLEQLIEAIKAHPEMFKGIVAESVKEMTEAQRADLEKQIRTALGVGETEDLAKALTEAADAKKQLAEQARQQAVSAAIAEATKGLPYGDSMNKMFGEELKESVRDAGEVPGKAQALRKRYDAMVAEARLRGMGRDVTVLGPVLESETGVPEFARAAHEFTESMVARGIAQRRDLRKSDKINDVIARRMLERFDQVHRLPLMREAKLLQEAELSTDLNLPYSVSRAIMAEVWPTLVATSIFDVDTTEQSPTRVYYEDYADETGKHVAISDEHVTVQQGEWVALAHKMIEPGTVVWETTGDSGTYVEGTDYVMDYVDGKVWAITGGSLTDNTAFHVTYHYDAVREGENTEIQQAKVNLAYETLDCKANRLATQITNEAIVFSRSQLGWDATARTLAQLVNELRRVIDKALMYTALSQALKVATNSGGTWTAASDPLIDLVSYIGVAKVKVAKRFFQPQFVLLSATNSDTLGNWDGFTAAGSRPDANLNANGFVGLVKGLPAFQSTEFSDAFGLVGNKQLLHYRVYIPMALKGPFPTYGSNHLLVAAEQWYAEQFDGHVSPVAGKGSYVKIA
jgi:hypothetical protein